MTLISAPRLLYPSILARDSAATGNSVTIDADDEICACIVQAPRTGTITKIGWRTGTYTAGTSGTIQVGLETLNTSGTVDTPASYISTNAYAERSTFASNTTYWETLTSSASVTKGDKFAIVVRAKSSTFVGRTVNVTRVNNYNTNDYPYMWTYLNATGAFTSGTCNFGLEYNDGVAEIVPMLYSLPAVNVTIQTYNSGSSPDRYGLKFQLDFPCKLDGIQIGIDRDEEVDIILYDSDEYTVLDTVNLKSAQRGGTSRGLTAVLFDSNFTLAKDTWYRIVVLPKSTTNVSLGYLDVTDDAGVSAMNGVEGGTNLVWTSFTGTPTSGSHTWSDTTTRRPLMTLILSHVDDGTSTGGSMGISQGMHTISDGVTA